MNIHQLISYGYSAMDIMEKLFKKQPKQLKNIKNLISYGYPAADILKQLVGDKKRSAQSYMTEEEKYKDIEQSQRSDVLDITKGAAGIGAGLAAARYLPGMLQGLQQEQPEEQMQAPTEQNVPVGEKFQDYMSQLPEEKMPQEQEPSEELMQPRARKSSIETSFPELAQTTKKFLDKGMSPEQAYDTLKKSKLYSKLVKEYEEVEGEPYLESIKRKQPGKPTMIDRQKLMQAVSELRQYMQ
jgi:hypothetical protein